MDRETLLAILELIFLFLLVISVFRIIFRLIKWIFRGIWTILTGRKPKKDLTKSNDWLTRSMAKQEIRFQNAMPPILEEKKSFFRRKKPKKKTVPEVQVKEDPNKKFENNPDWKWDEKNKLWRYKTQWDKIEK